MSESGPVPPLGGHSLLVFLCGLVVLLVVAVLLGSLAAWFRMPPLIGELMTGVVLGPSLLAVVWPDVSDWLFPHDPARLQLLDGVGQLGVLMLVGVTGWQLDLSLVRRRGATAVRISLPGLIIPFAMGVATGLLVPASMLAAGSERAVFAAFLGVAMGVTAIPVIAKTLMDMNLMHRNIGQLTIITGTIDDVVAWFALSVVTAMATTGVRVGGVLRSLVFLILFVLFAVVVGRRLVAGLLRMAARTGHQGTLIAAVAAVVLGASALTQALGLEAVFGALVAGMMVRTSGPDVLGELAPLRGFVVAVLAPIFFALAGLRMDLGALRDPTTLLVGLALLAVAVLGKFAGAALGALLSGLSRWEAVALGAGMNARGVVEVVVAMVGVRLGVLSTGMYTVVVLIAVITSLMSPPILRFAMARVEVTAEERLRAEEKSFVGGPALEHS